VSEELKRGWCASLAPEMDADVHVVEGAFNATEFGRVMEDDGTKYAIATTESRARNALRQRFFTTFSP